MSEHLTVLKEEAVELLVTDTSGLYVDCTFGRGGHTRHLLDQLSPDATVMAFDRDEAAEQSAEALVDDRFEFVRGAFSKFGEETKRRGLEGQFDGILMDLGVSSPQLDTPERGFSFRFDAPLDMRMDTSQGPTAADWLNSAEEADITHVLRTYGEERFARRIAREIVARQETAPLTTTGELVEICERCVPKRPKEKKNPATRTFQAVRIHINEELKELETILEDTLMALKPGGRLVVISFHSLEDRIVKHFIRKQSKPPQLPKSIPVQFEQVKMPLKAMGKAIFAGDTELEANPRARSAVMRVAVRNPSE